jgi:hypothetical protein
MRDLELRWGRGCSTGFGTKRLQGRATNTGDKPVLNAS